MFEAGAGKSRRQLLRSVVAVAVAAPVLAACDLLDGDPPAPPPPDPLTAFHAATGALAARYDAAIKADATLAAIYGPIRDTHRAHAGALAAIMRPAPSAAPTPASSGAPSGPDNAATLREAETAARQSAFDICLTAPATRATLLGEIAAARACHLEVIA